MLWLFVLLSCGTEWVGDSVAVDVEVVLSGVGGE